jgi:hypothetical protein
MFIKSKQVFMVSSFILCVGCLCYLTIANISTQDIEMPLSSGPGLLEVTVKDASSNPITNNHDWVQISVYQLGSLISCKNLTMGYESATFMSLTAGQYDVYVAHPSYRTNIQIVQIIADNLLQIQVNLELNGSGTIDPIVIIVGVTIGGGAVAAAVILVPRFRTMKLSKLRKFEDPLTANKKFEDPLTANKKFEDPLTANKKFEDPLTANKKFEDPLTANKKFEDPLTANKKFEDPLTANKKFEDPLTANKKFEDPLTANKKFEDPLTANKKFEDPLTANKKLNMKKLKDLGNTQNFDNPTKP